MIFDLLVAGAVLSLVILVGLRKLGVVGNPLERFTAGRQMSWLALGASQAASSMSADTPLLIAGAVFMDGFAGNWFWWAGAPGCLATLFFFAKLWRRSGVITEVEIFKLRYGPGLAAQRYRILQAFVEGIFLNVLVLASNGYAFGLVLHAMLRRWRLDADPRIANVLVIVCFVAAALYALLVGFRGLVKSDATGFILAVLAGAMLAFFAVFRLPNGIADLQNATTARSGGSIFALWSANEPLVPFLLLSLGWWHSAPGRGMLIQRIVASRDERSAMRTVGTFVIFHFLLRPWGWYLIGAAALHYLPPHSNPDIALPALAASVLPEGLFGIILAVTALAFMGCVNSRLNFGASYAVNDIAPSSLRSSARSARLIEIVTVGLLTAAALTLVATGSTTSIRTLYQFLTMMLAGTGFVAIARWYWSRTSIYCEIGSLASSALVACASLTLIDISRPADFAIAVATNFLIGAAVTSFIALYGPPTPLDVLQAFQRKVAPGGPGWRNFGTASGSEEQRFGTTIIQWLSANLALFAAIAAGVRFLAMDFLWGIAFTLLAVSALSVQMKIAGRTASRP